MEVLPRCKRELRREKGASTRTTYHDVSVCGPGKGWYRYRLVRLSR